MLCRTDYQVLVARDGEERLAIARREHPDLILLDLMLPWLDGLEVCRAIRCECDVPIIMLTARESEIGRLVGLELGADSREDQRLYRIPPSGIDRGMGGPPKGITVVTFVTMPRYDLVNLQVESGLGGSAWRSRRTLSQSSALGPPDG